MRKRHRQRGPLCAALSKLYGGQDPYTIVRAFARDLVFTSKQQGPPFSPFLFARSLGLRVVYDAIDAEGLLMDGEHGVALREPGVPRELFPSGEGGALDDGLRGPVIKLRERWSRSGRRRSHFTLGHEIGHFVIREALSGFVPMSMFALENPEEERLADEFAGELLVPKFWLRKDLKRLGLDPSALVSLADRYEVSLQCLLTSVTKLFGRGKVGTVIWEKVEGLYRAGWACPRSFGEMLLCDTGRTTVERAFGSSATEEGTDCVLLEGRREFWQCVSQRLPASAKVLSVMRRADGLGDFVVEKTNKLGQPRAPVPVQLCLPV